MVIVIATGAMELRLRELMLNDRSSSSR
eukprot:COSAG01_NODE_71481_length_255_cov_3.839744_1_plen_27_part_10